MAPHGCGDFHTPRGPLPKLLKFEEWGRYVMMCHDGRFARHSRFKYWLLNTSPRLMTTGIQRTYFKTPEAACQYTLKDLEDKEIRRNLVQQISTTTNQLPGSIGERRNMRQQLEAMVHQIEAETADLGENAGVGRIPAGFGTLTCPVFKWRQLHDTLLKSYPSGNASDPKAREYYQQWYPLSSGPEKEMATKKGFYELAVGNHAGGIPHAHITFWVIGAREKEEIVVEIDVDADESTALANDEAANLLGSFWDRVLTEFNVAKALSSASAQCNTQQGSTDSDSQASPATEVRTQEPPFEGNDATANPTTTSFDVNSLFDLRAGTGVRHKLGKKIGREKPSPETLSYEALSHCLIGDKPVTWHGLEDDKRKQEEFQAELVSILTECGRGGVTRDILSGIKNSENQDVLPHCRARKVKGKPTPTDVFELVNTVVAQHLATHPMTLPDFASVAGAASVPDYVPAASHASASGADPAPSTVSKRSADAPPDAGEAGSCAKRQRTMKRIK